MSQNYDLAIIGAGSGGLTAAAFAARLGAKTALIEKASIGGDCTWTGCVPSKALLKAAKVAHECRTASHYGITTPKPTITMSGVRDYVRRAIEQVYQFETPEELQKQGIEVIPGEAMFADSTSVCAGDRTITANTFLITTGAHPSIPPIDGIRDVPYLTYEKIFEVDRLPNHLIVIGGGPIGCELAQAYRRFGSEVTIVSPKLLEKEEPEARARLEGIFSQEGIRRAHGFAEAVRQEGAEIIVSLEDEEVRGDLLLVASGRLPNVARLGLENAGVEFSPKGISVDSQLRTNVRHIYAAGDVTGGYQFTHYAGWQAFQAVRNALLPGHSEGHSDVVPWVTFTEPEVAHVGLTEEAAKSRFGEKVRTCLWEMDHVDRAICDYDTAGFIKVVTGEDGTVLGATIVAARAGEIITEFVLAIQHKWKVKDLAGAIHPYPTYATPVQQLAAEMTIDHLLGGTSGRVLLSLSKLIR